MSVEIIKPHQEQNAHDISEYHVASFVLQVIPKNMTSLVENINGLAGAEVHVQSEEGKIVLTIEKHNQRAISKTADEIRMMSGVLTLAPVYHQYIDEKHNANA